ncbi:protein still life, isoform SIF type 1 isoform X3 [Trichogramma pretiosum]|uniref:protein still life, isoform SIF type 1 isoform X3 n=1 Tax=Trichogramma pretiosum TaxID=7493 RepID=UPI0006C94D05|nr:protein still life, isoform SIF type 1 isoform X3 [Trichogramma pretiosum]XP_014226612.1 protein still life, isoform SIF type 1 isoform X3 [Trichogramma pretiosum]XP_014226613.1 protein still life, isoform SIF type 1 isoform X3 [Trichogramma pretiosum]XP_014226614.1 protein still life, isoform SIF type 1 isoform X3 [Trichogramma pretiosum]XP_023316627.1 protein still life, isoform SIF type 1 isoform X3 [Trichogramma pretiosum]XP_023316628.1 protein still life, isoform SIF type 1 isoform X3 
MGNKLSCSCAPLIKKGYRYEDSPWQANARGRSSAGGERRGETGHLLRCGSLRERKSANENSRNKFLRLWAEVFHVTSGAGSVKWQQVSEDLVPVNITCIQDTPETIFHITAYNCQVDKILDVRLVQPGTRIGQASECFVYWKDTMTNDTWGLNFTCPIDAKQFRECVSPSFKIPRKASSSYSLRLEPLNSKQSSTKQKVRRKPLSTPASPSRGASREPQCTCMTPEQFNRLRQDPRYRPTCAAAQTLPRLTSRSADAEMQQRGDKMPNAVSSGSLYDNVNNSNNTGVGPGGQMTANSAAQGKLLKPGEQQQQQQQHTLRRQTSVDKQQQSEQMCQTGVKTANVGIGTTNVGSQVRRAWFMQDQVEGPDGENKVGSATPGGGPHPKKPLLKHQDSMTRQTSFDMGTQSSLGGGLMPGGRYQHRKEQLQHTRSADYTEMELRNGNLFASLDNNNVPPGTRRNKKYGDNANVQPGQQPSQRTPTPRRRSSANKSSTLPQSYRYCTERQNSRDRDGYYSDRNEIMRERRERDYDRDRGYQSDYNSQSRCASCIGESARAQWFRHSDGWRSGSSTFGSTASSVPTYTGFHRGGPWDSLPSLRHEGSLNDSGYKSNRTDSLEHRGTFDRQDSVRSDYMSDRESRYGIVQQASLESTDSRLCYLTSSEMSDDDRMSLTTAVSDDDDGESAVNSPYRGKQTGQAAASFNCTGAVRKAGFLSVKKWLLRKKHQIELARKRGWKGYWVCLKGTTLLFYPCESQENRAVETAPKHLIIVDGAIMQPIPEHPKRDYIFCLSTAFGDAYLFQAPCQVELENWVNSIHSACAAAFARHRGKTGTLHLLQEEIFRLDKAIETDHKLRHMADLQQSVVTDIDTKSQINNQIMQYEENLERLHCEQFRLRCYMASLQSGELPNPKSLLTHVSRATKQMLNKLGVFTVSSFHAYICARSPSLLNNLLAGRGATKRRPLLLSRSNSGSSRRSLQISRDDDKNVVKVTVPENQLVSVFLRDGMTVEEFLASACSRKGLNAMEHFVRVKKRRDMEDHNYFVPHRSDVIETYLHTHEIVEVCAKILYQVELQRNTLDQMWGFSVEAELIENADRQDELCCYVSRVEDKSVAMQNGIIKGDEIMVINGAIVSDLDMMYLESVLQEEQALCMMMRSSRTEPPDVTGIMRVTDDIIESLVCPPPPQDPPVISEEMISGLIVPAPGWTKEQVPDSLSAHDGSKPTSRANSFEIENLLKTAEQVTGICRSPGKASPTGSVLSAHSQALTPSRQLTDAEKLKKVILELVETERTYVKNLNSLLENYLEPLKRETFLSNAEINALFGNIQEIVAFQRQFLQNLDHAIEVEPEFLNFEHPSQFKGVLFSIGSAFLFYVNHFKLYSSFCASHSKAQKVLHPNEGNQALQEFLQARNPRQQHSSTLESYLIKPIQRILKYPLLLQQLRNLTDEHSDERRHLIGALNGMEKVAEHINEMQRIHEEYGAIFDHLFRQHQKSCKQSIDLSPGDLLYYGGVEWLNISDFLGKIKKGLELHAMCFVFKSAVVFLCKEKLRQKKKLMFDLQGGSKANTGKKNDGDVEIIRYQVLIPVTEVQVRSSSAKDMESHFLWELIHLRSQLQRRSEKVYVLSNSTSDFRNSFLKTIRQIIRESVRNMSIPSTSNPALVDYRSQQLAQQTMTMGRHHDRSDKSSSAATNGHHPSVPPSLPTGSSGGTGTLSKKAMKQQMLSNTLGARRKYTHTRQPIDRDSSEDAEELHHQQMRQHHGQQTFRTRSKTISDSSGETKVEMESGAKSEGEEDSQAYGGEKKTNLGRTPNHLTLSTTSTISAGSTGSQAKLIQSSHHPENYQPAQIKELGSPVWKPRELGESMTLPRKGKASAAEFAEATSSLQHGGASRKSLFEINNHV